MRYLILYAHPNPESFNHAIKEQVEVNLRQNGKEFEVRDLYQLGFDPILKGNDFAAIKAGKPLADVGKEQEYIRNADTVIFIHPIWWFSMPAVLKGYIDRVFSYGFAYDLFEGRPRGLLTEKKAIVLNTTGGTEEAYKAGELDEALGRTMDAGTYGFCGMKVILHKFFYAVPTLSKEIRVKILNDIRRLNL